ncbi:MAG: hypothetical protein M3454_07550 [Actinomycetota bacterium]|nr:hypothetical protein [Actinomycetota bacterium]
MSAAVSGGAHGYVDVEIVPRLKPQLPAKRGSVVSQDDVVWGRVHPHVGPAQHSVFALIGKAESLFGQLRNKGCAARDALPQPSDFEDVSEVSCYIEVQVGADWFTTVVSQVDVLIQPFGQQPISMEVERELWHQEIIPIEQIWI